MILAPNVGKKFDRKVGDAVSVISKLLSGQRKLSCIDLEVICQKVHKVKVHKDVSS